MRFLAAFAACIATPALSGVLITQSGSDELRLYDGACTHGGTLARISPDKRSTFRKAQAEVSGKLLFGCWTEIPGRDDLLWVLLEGAQGLALPRAAFHSLPEA